MVQQLDAVNFVKRSIKKIEVRNKEHEAYTFYEPGEMPFFSFYVWVIDQKCAMVRDRFPRLIKALNVSLRKGVMKVTHVYTERNSRMGNGGTAYRLKVRVEDTMLEPLKKLNFRLRFTTGPVALFTLLRLLN